MTTDPAETPPDPATPERRLELARMLLVSAIRQYDEAQNRWTVVREAYPNLPYPEWPCDDLEREERKAWKQLFVESDEDFDAAELQLASRIQGLYDQLAPPGRRAADDEGDYFVPRAVRHRGTIYVLAYDVNRHEVESNIIAVYRESMTLDLDAAPDRVNSDVA